MNKSVDLQYILKELQELKSMSSFAKETLTLEEACLYCDISKSYMYKLTSKQLVPHYQPFGKKLYFDKTELDKWLKSNHAASESNISYDSEEWLKSLKL
jgi:excisionase family DNA binding protein